MKLIKFVQHVLQDLEIVINMCEYFIPWTTLVLWIDIPTGPRPSPCRGFVNTLMPPHSVGLLLRVIDLFPRPIPENEQLSQETDIHGPGGFSNPQSQQAVGRSRTPQTAPPLGPSDWYYRFVEHKAHSPGPGNATLLRLNHFLIVSLQLSRWIIFVLCPFEISTCISPYLTKSHNSVILVRPPMFFSSSNSI